MPRSDCVARTRDAGHARIGEDRQGRRGARAAIRPHDGDKGGLGGQASCRLGGDVGLRAAVVLDPDLDLVPLDRRPVVVLPPLDRHDYGVAVLDADRRVGTGDRRRHAQDDRSALVDDDWDIGPPHYPRRFLCRLLSRPTRGDRRQKEHNKKRYTTPDVLSLPLIATTRNADAQIARPRPHRTRGGQVDDAHGTAICRRSTIRPVAPDSVICVTPAEAAAVSIPERAATTLGSRSQDPSTLHSGRPMVREPYLNERRFEDHVE